MPTQKVRKMRKMKDCMKKVSLRNHSVGLIELNMYAITKKQCLSECNIPFAHELNEEEAGGNSDEHEPTKVVDSLPPTFMFP